MSVIRAEVRPVTEGNRVYMIIVDAATGLRLPDGWAAGAWDRLDGVGYFLKARVEHLDEVLENGWPQFARLEAVFGDPAHGIRLVSVDDPSDTVELCACDAKRYYELD